MPGWGAPGWENQLRKTRLRETGLRHTGLRQSSLSALVWIVRIAGRTRLIALPLPGPDVNALTWAQLIAAGLLHFGDEILLVGLLLAVLLRAVDQRVGEDAARADVDDAPIVFARHGIDIFLAQETEILRVLQGVEIGREAIELSHEEIDRARILLAAVDEQLLLVALGFECDAG